MRNSSCKTLMKAVTMLEYVVYSFQLTAYIPRKTNSLQSSSIRIPRAVCGCKPSQMNATAISPPTLTLEGVPGRGGRVLKTTLSVKE